MGEDDAVRQLMAKLIQAVETSIAASSAVRQALAELVRNGYEARLIFVANAESAKPEESDAAAAPEAAELVVDERGSRVTPEIGAVPDGGELRFELTKLDREFLKSLRIRPEGS